MDESWIGAADHLSDEYVHGVAKFLEFAFFGKEYGSRISCPCCRCRNQFSKTCEDAMLHCLRDGFDHTYTSWTCHGEMHIPLHTSEDNELPTNDHGDDMASMLRDAIGIPNKDDHMENDQHLNGADAETKRYLNDVETKENRPPRNNDGDNNMGQGLYGGTRCIIDKDTLLKIHRYVLSNIDLVAPYREATASAVPKELIALADGPAPHAKRYNACIVDTLSFASAKDLNPRSGTVSYYGVLKDILQIQYTKDTQFLMFECDWVDNEKGLKQDEFKFTLVNFNHLMYNKNLPTDEPFVLASQVQQVWYISDPSEAGWHVVVTMTRRDNYDVYSTIEAEPHSRVQLDDNIPSRNEDVCWVREGVEGLFVDETVTMIEDVEVGNDIEIEDDFDV
ncbi:hypothetical protein Salat_1878900 [Sesamum alatum]|uniref:Transposase-associated domain-containing protein n=1 Tax=Sesamum alatum TaxID=300844 RepID=A0AAE1Y3C8_9LAMI|nr:hypothetical protein Salat_1878900 [Sesamum alatum]